MRYSTPRRSVRALKLEIVSLMVICSLVTPSVFIGLATTAKAGNNASSQQPIPISAPPLSFSVPVSESHGSAIWSKAMSLASLPVWGVTALFSASTETTEALVADSKSEVLSMPQPASIVDFDFDGDGKADVGRWKPGTSEFEIDPSGGGANLVYDLGSSTSKFVPGDFNGGGSVDAAVFDSGTWTYKTGPTASAVTITLGQSGDVPTPADFDGDGITDAAVFRPSSGTWHIKQSSTGNTVSTAFGTTGDVPVVGDYDGDGRADFAVFRPSTGYWHIQGSTSGYSTFPWGISSDVPTPADYDGDGKTDPAVYRGSTGTWWALKSSTGYATHETRVWGSYGDQPVPGDYDGDSKADFAVWRPTTGVWYIAKSSGGHEYHTLGVVGDRAVPSAFIKQIGGEIAPYELAKARLSPKNATGGTDLYSQNFSWGTSLVGLPGRAGLNAGFGMSYNSLVWTREGSNVHFDTNYDNISPGFRFGFPTIEAPYYVPGTGETSNPYFAYVMVSPSGARTEFRQIAASGTFETADSSYLQLTSKSAPDPNTPVEDITLTVRGTDGTQMTYVWIAGAFRCTRILDRNGNYITIDHSEYGQLTKVTDTLGREIVVNYSEDLYPTSITQTWKDTNGSGSNTTHPWATFGYANITLNPTWNTAITSTGPPAGTILKVLEKVTYPDLSSTKFSYNAYGQVSKIENIAADSPTHVLNHVRTNLESPGSNLLDVPRLGLTRTFVENFNSGNETVVTNTLTTGHQVTDIDGGSVTATLIQVAMQNHPTGNVTNTFVGETGWMESLPIRTDDYAVGNGLELKRSSWTRWTQDDPNSADTQNPRVTETKIGDGVNLKRASIEYLLYPSTTVSKFGLVSAVNVYDTDQSTVVKRAETDYNFSSVYTDRRIIGLTAESRTWGRETTGLNLISKTTYLYDEGNFGDTTLSQNIAPVQHDSAKFNAEFVLGRGNLTSATNHDVLQQSPSITLSAKYNTAGSVVAQTDSMSRTIKIKYADNFNSSGNPVTYAYPTQIITSGVEASTEINSYIKYRYDLGANVLAQSPAPFGGATTPNQQGMITSRRFDPFGRLELEKIENTGAYTKYVYNTSQIFVEKRSTIVDFNGNGVADVGDEVSSFTYLDGNGRPRATRTEHPGSTGGWSGQLTEYDILGQVKRQSIQTEINNNLQPDSWQPMGDDSSRGWIWNAQEYDWKGRAVRGVNTDGTDKLISYDGCGCAGGEITTVKGELITETNPQGQTSDLGRRTTRTYADTLGRQYKTEILNWDESVYSSTVTKFNGRDQAEWIKQFDGPAPADALNSDSCPMPQPNQPQSCQLTRLTYDGFGRVKTEHTPNQDATRSTSYEYNNDHQVHSVTDARGAKRTLQYEHRGLLSQVSYSAPIEGEALRPGITATGNNGNNIWVHGSNFATDVTVIMFQYDINLGGFLELGRFSSGQLTRGTTSDGQQSVSFQTNNSQVIDALNNNRAKLYVKNTASERTSNFAYQDYIGQWRIASPGSTAEIIEAPSPVTFSYDSVGNRVSMDDGVGRVDYEYDELSRLKSETRAFTDSLPQAPLPNNSYRTAYQYNLNGSLKSVTDPFGYQTNYSVDKTGKTLQVAGQIQFASNVKYRAWGGIKEVTSYGGVNQQLTYDNRLRISEYQDSFTSGVNAKFTYAYQADGTMYKVGREYQGGQSSVEMNFNRYFQFDHMGRMVAAKTGKKARGETAENCDVPFDLQYAYDKFGHITARNAWNRMSSTVETEGTGTYTNNRSVVYQHDADGRIVGNKIGLSFSDDILVMSSYAFNAAGLIRSSSGDGYKQELWQDGDGYNTKQQIWTPDSETGVYEVRTTNYNIQSSVLGEVIARADQNGNRSESLVYGLGRKLGTYKRQKTQTVPTPQYQEFQMVEKADPSGTYYASLGQAPDGSSRNEFAELTPENVNMKGAMEVACPYEPPPPQPPLDPYDGWRYGGFGSSDGGMSCTIDGVESSCSTAMGMLANGSGYEVALGTSYFDLYNPDGSHVGGGALSTGWMPVDSFGTSRDRISSEDASRLASPTGQGLADNWRAQFGVSSVSAETGVIEQGWDTEVTATVYGPADARLGSSSVTVRAVSTGLSSSGSNPTSSGSNPTVWEIVRATSQCLTETFGGGDTDRKFKVSGVAFAQSGTRDGEFRMDITQAQSRVENRVVVVGPVTEAMVVTTDAQSMSGPQLAAKQREIHPSDPRDTLVGYTLPGGSTKNYLANDLANRPNAGMETGLEKIIGISVAGQIHELGVSISARYGKRSPPKQYTDRDSGMTLEHCVYNDLK